MMANETRESSIKYFKQQVKNSTTKLVKSGSVGLLGDVLIETASTIGVRASEFYWSFVLEVQ